MLNVTDDKFDDRKIELNEIKTVFNEFVAKASLFEKIIGVGNNMSPLLSDIRQRFDKLFDILYLTNEKNRAKGFKDYSTNVPEARSKFESCNIFDAKEYYDQKFPIHFDDLGNKISVLEVTKRVVNNLLLKLIYYPLVIRKRILNCLYKLIDGKDSKETDEMRCDLDEGYRGNFFTILLLRDLPSISEVLSKAGFEPPFPDFVNFEYNKRFNFFLDVDITLKLCRFKEEFEDAFRDKDSTTEEKIKSLKREIEMIEFVCDQAEEEGLGTKEVINNVKNTIKMLLDNLEANKEPNKDEISHYLETMSEKTTDIVKSTYGIDDLWELYNIIF